MASFGVRVVVIEPNLYRTNIANADILNVILKSEWTVTDPDVQDAYGGEKYLERFKERLRTSVQVARPQIHEVVDAQEEAVTATDPDIYYRCAGIGERPGLWTLECVSDLSKDFVLVGRNWKRVLQFFSTKY